MANSKKTSVKPEAKPTTTKKSTSAAKTAKPSAAKKPATKTAKPVKAIEPEVKTATEAAKPAKSVEQVKPDKKIKVLFVTAEAFPFAGTGGLGEVAGSLPKALNAVGVETRVIMPLYGTIAQKYREKMTFVTQMRVMVGWRNQYCGLFKLENDGVVTYFIDNEYYFKRDKIYGCFDDAERFAFFSRAALCVLPALDFKPDVIHANDHATALVPVYYATEYKYLYGYEGIKTVFTIHNLEYQGCYPSFILGDVFGIAEHNRGIVDFNGQINCLKGALETSDIISTVSPTYAKEILVPDRSCGLGCILERNRHKIVGILNGINVDEYNPKTSPAICKNFDAEHLSGKAECKAAIKAELGLSESDRPLVAIISRLAGHKGLDLVKMLLEWGSSAFDNTDLIVLGTGENYLEEFFKHYASSHGNVRAVITYDKNLAQRIYAGADMFLMPSGAEPCGLSQMMACRYGTVPIVRRTGGLADSIVDCRGSDAGYGFLFDDYTPSALNATLADAAEMFKTENWKKVMHRAMLCDFSWNVSAKEYAKMYAEIK